MVLATTERCGGGNLQKLNYGSFGKPLSSSRPSTTNYGNLGNGRPPPPQNNVEKEQLRHSEKMFLDLRRRLLSSPQHCLWGGRGEGASIVKLLRRVCTIFVGNAFCTPRQHFRFVPEDKLVAEMFNNLTMDLPERFPALLGGRGVLSEPALRLVGVIYRCVP